MRMFYYLPFDILTTSRWSWFARRSFLDLSTFSSWLVSCGCRLGSNRRCSVCVCVTFEKECCVCCSVVGLSIVNYFLILVLVLPRSGISFRGFAQLTHHHDTESSRSSASSSSSSLPCYVDVGLDKGLLNSIHQHPHVCFAMRCLVVRPTVRPRLSSRIKEATETAVGHAITASHRHHQAAVGVRRCVVGCDSHFHHPRRSICHLRTLLPLGNPPGH